MEVVEDLTQHLTMLEGDCDPLEKRFSNIPRMARKYTWNGVGLKRLEGYRKVLDG